MYQAKADRGPAYAVAHAENVEQFRGLIVPLRWAIFTAIRNEYLSERLAKDDAESMEAAIKSTDFLTKVVAWYLPVVVRRRNRFVQLHKLDEVLREVIDRIIETRYQEGSDDPSYEFELRLMRYLLTVVAGDKEALTIYEKTAQHVVGKQK